MENNKDTLFEIITKYNENNNITKAQISCLTGDQISYLTEAQISYLTGAQVTICIAKMKNLIKN